HELTPARQPALEHLGALRQHTQPRANVFTALRVVRARADQPAMRRRQYVEPCDGVTGVRAGVAAAFVLREERRIAVARRVLVALRHDRAAELLPARDELRGRAGEEPGAQRFGDLGGE